MARFWRIVSLVLVALAVSVTTVLSQVENRDTRGYDSLPGERVEDIARRVQPYGARVWTTGQWLLGAAREFKAYATLTEAQRATYEAIVHALDHLELLDTIDAVTAIWGEGRASAGADQFRLSVVLSLDAPSVLKRKGFKFEDGRHVKFSSGRREGSGTASAREPGTIPKLQVSWLEGDPRMGEIDIDYHSHRVDDVWGIFSHLDSSNSDVRGHYCSHRKKYHQGGLIDWWNESPEECRDVTEPESYPQAGWVQLGPGYNPDSWALEVQDVQSLAPGSRVLVKRFRNIRLTKHIRAAPLGTIDKGACVRLLEEAEHESGDLIWVRIQRVEPVLCEASLER